MNQKIRPPKSVLPDVCVRSPLHEPHAMWTSHDDLWNSYDCLMAVTVASNLFLDSKNSERFAKLSNAREVTSDCEGSNWAPCCTHHVRAFATLLKQESNFEIRSSNYSSPSTLKLGLPTLIACLLTEEPNEPQIAEQLAADSVTGLNSIETGDEYLRRLIWICS